MVFSAVGGGAGGGGGGGGEGGGEGCEGGVPRRGEVIKMWIYGLGGMFRCLRPSLLSLMPSHSLQSHFERKMRKIIKTIFRTFQPKAKLPLPRGQLKRSVESEGRRGEGGGYTQTTANCSWKGQNYWLCVILMEILLARAQPFSLGFTSKNLRK